MRGGVAFGWKADLTSRKLLVFFSGEIRNSPGRENLRTPHQVSISDLGFSKCEVLDDVTGYIQLRLSRRQSPLEPLFGSVKCQTLLAFQCRCGRLENVDTTKVLQIGNRKLCSRDEEEHTDSLTQCPVSASGSITVVASSSPRRRGPRLSKKSLLASRWVPAFAGMTGRGRAGDGGRVNQT